MKIDVGVLLPSSTLFPTIGVEYFKALHSAVKYAGLKGEEITFHTASIDFGTDEAAVFKQAEQMLLQHSLQALVVFADNLHAHKLYQLTAADNVLLIMVDAGANYPPQDAANQQVIYYSLNDALCCYLTGKLAQKEQGSGFTTLATNLFDGGYQHCHAITKGFALNAEAIGYTHVTGFKADQFTLDPLHTFLQTQPAINSVLAVFCGDMAAFFYEHFSRLKEHEKWQVYGSPMMLDNSVLQFASDNLKVPTVKGFVPWVSSFQSPENEAFKQDCADRAKPVSLFALMGWETGLLLAKALESKKSIQDLSKIREALNGCLPVTPRGQLLLHHTGTIVGPVFQVKADEKLTLTVENEIADPRPQLDELIADTNDLVFSRWKNTYLCI